MNNLRNSDVNESLRNSLTEDRLGKYLSQSKQDLDFALKLYEHNTKLSEAFYTPLQSLEVCLRNSLHSKLTAKYGEYWHQAQKSGPRPPFERNSREMIEHALSELKPDDQLRPGSVVAELKFAFWVGLCAKKYDKSLWRDCLFGAFLAKGGKKRGDVYARLNALRRFRNRVAHHEPILWHQLPAPQLNQEIIEAIGWMCRHTSNWADSLSRVSEVAKEAPRT